jgi:hypothetical protein
VAGQRRIEELIFVDQPAWPLVLEDLANTRSKYEVLDTDESSKRAALMELQVTVGSLLGAIVFNCGAILIDHGWVKLLGAGAGSLPAAHVEKFRAGERDFIGVIAAYDVLGGCFVIHGEGLDVAPGEVCFWAPNALTWEPLGLGHSALVRLLLSDQLALFYEDLRWPDWKETCKALKPDEGISAYPPPFSKEGRPDQAVTRDVAPLDQVVAAGFWYANELGTLPGGAKFTVDVPRSN